MQGGKGASGRDSKDRSAIGAAATLRRAVEVAIAPLCEATNRKAPLARAIVEGMERGEASGVCDPEDCSTADGTAILGRAVEMVVDGLDEACLGKAAVGTVAGKGMQGGKDEAVRRDPEHGACTAGAARIRRAVEMAIAGLDEAADGCAALGGVGEETQGGEGAGRRDLEDAAADFRAIRCGRAVEVTVAGLHQRAWRGHDASLQAGEGVKEFISDLSSCSLGAGQ